MPYLRIVEGKQLSHPNLLIEKRWRMKIMLLDPTRDLPIKTIKSILKEALDLYREGVVKV